MAKIPLEKLTIENGAPFPFSVEEVIDIAVADVLPRVIAIDRGTAQYRVCDAGDGKNTADALRRLVAEHSTLPLTEWKPEDIDEDEPEPVDP